MKKNKSPIGDNDDDGDDGDSLTVKKDVDIPNQF